MKATNLFKRGMSLLGFALICASLPAAAADDESYDLNLTVGLECQHGHLVDFDGAFFTAPDTSIPLVEVGPPPASLGVSDSWKGTFEQTLSRSGMDFPVKILVIKTLSDDGRISYVLNISQGNRGLVSLSAPSAEALHSVKVGQLVGQSVIQGDRTCRPLFTLQ